MGEDASGVNDRFFDSQQTQISLSYGICPECHEKVRGDWFGDMDNE